MEKGIARLLLTFRYSVWPSKYCYDSNKEMASKRIVNQQHLGAKFICNTILIFCLGQFSIPCTIFMHVTCSVPITSLMLSWCFWTLQLQPLKHSGWEQWITQMRQNITRKVWRNGSIISRIQVCISYQELEIQIPWQNSWH